MATILVTGCAGFIGFHTAKALLERGDTVVGVDSLTPYYDPRLKRARLRELRRVKGGRFTFHKVDIADYAAMQRVFKKRRIRKVCHLAAQAGVRYSLTNPFAYEHANNLGTMTLLELCRLHGVGHFIFASSSSVYGGNRELPFKEEHRVDTHISAYAATKKYNEVLAHAYHHLYGIHCTGLRFFTVYGPWGRPDLSLFKFAKNILEGKPIELYNRGRHARDFTYIDDIVQGVLAAIDRSYPYEIFNLGRGNKVALREFVVTIEEILGRKAKKRLLPMQKGDVEATHADIRKAKRMLGFRPRTGLREGVAKFLDWYREYHGVGA
jgi:UDP-glucuronate 4-epimerase